MFSHHDDDDQFDLSEEFLQDNRNQQEQIYDLSVLSSLMSYHIHSEEILSSECQLIRSKFQRVFQFLQTDIYNEPMKQALGDQMTQINDVDEALIKLNRNATLKFRNYKQFRERVRLAAFNERPSTSNVPTPHYSTFYSRYSLRLLLHSITFKWFISIIICLDAISVAITTEYSSPSDSKTLIYSIAVLISRCILFIYLFEVLLKWIDDFSNFWYSSANILEFILTVISLINFISEIYINTKENASTKLDRKLHSRSFEMLERIRSYGSILSLFRTLRMLRILRILEIAFRFTQVRIVFLALSRSVKLIFHVVLLTIVLNYFFALIALFLTQFGLNTSSNEDTTKINSLFGTVPRAFITVFRLFTKDEWFEIKARMYTLKINPWIIDIYIIGWLFFGGYVLNPLLVGAMVGTFDEIRKEMTKDIKQILSKTRLSLNESNLSRNQSLTSTFSTFLAHLNSIDNDHERFNDWLRLTSDEMRLITSDRIEIQWPIYTAFSYLQLLEIYFENLAERQLLFDFFSIYLLTLHDKETKSFDPPILSSSSSDDDDVD